MRKNVTLANTTDEKKQNLVYLYKEFHMYLYTFSRCEVFVVVIHKCGAVGRIPKPNSSAL